jgi:hypothetical protein
MIWLKRRQDEKPSEIAREFKVSRPFVSKAQRIAEERIKELMQHAAKVNRINIQHFSAQYGIAIGYCAAHKMNTYILFSPTIGVQVWFDHEGECGTCSEKKNCLQTLHQLASEWNIPFKKKETPSELAAHMFEEIRGRLKWDF